MAMLVVGANAGKPCESSSCFALRADQRDWSLLLGKWWAKMLYAGATVITVSLPFGMSRTVDTSEEARGSLLEFIGILAALVKRISASVAVQLLAATVVSKQPLRSVRITLLLGVVAYFLFLSESSSFGKRRVKER